MLMADPALQHISSSLVRELAVFGGDYDFCLPEEIVAAVHRHFGKNA